MADLQLNISIDASRCPLCGMRNECALASGDGENEKPCWCFGESFPSTLRERAKSVDDGASCICRACLDRAASQSGRD